MKTHRPQSGLLLKRHLGNDHALVGVLHFPLHVNIEEGASYILIMEHGEAHLSEQIASPQTHQKKIIQKDVDGWLTSPVWRISRYKEAREVRMFKAFPESNGWVVFGPGQENIQNDQWISVRDGKYTKTKEPDGFQGAGLTVAQTLSLPVWPNAHGKRHTLPREHSSRHAVYAAQHFVQAFACEMQLDHTALTHVLRMIFPPEEHGLPYTMSHFQSYLHAQGFHLRDPARHVQYCLSEEDLKKKEEGVRKEYTERDDDGASPYSIDDLKNGKLRTLSPWLQANHATHMLVDMIRAKDTQEVPKKIWSALRHHNLHAMMLVTLCAMHARDDLMPHVLQCMDWDGKEDKDKHKELTRMLVGAHMVTPSGTHRHLTPFFLPQNNSPESLAHRQKYLIDSTEIPMIDHLMAEGLWSHQKDKDTEVMGRALNSPYPFEHSLHIITHLRAHYPPDTWRQMMRRVAGDISSYTHTHITKDQAGMLLDLGMDPTQIKQIRAAQHKTLKQSTPMFDVLLAEAMRRELNKAVTPKNKNPARQKKMI